ncbi:SEP-domain-containing protein [Coccomyxa subellipsoidea C-169]|uniref:SEP-domain-containing protein n=1 Tax=Coccomyxa subellipsoidea (strain C-169) TaxID=574566 RepID=I0YU61_COCSC|nr:SEP-domain-containing protein [Coccomyxa subellipsoidea C-169]EIE21930.1 SEP-domain-containing protein [Coccomyxa subellipsoidea C-169]|eukprot:XP_005646474.1 SEP-domain-containing protein [Coccomyxa subellipsoidea C-169]
MADSASIAQFTDVTGASQEAAKFFLDSSEGVVDAAIDQYFATGGEMFAPAAPEEAMEEAEPIAQPVLPRQAAPVPAAAAPPPRASAASSRGARPAAQPRGNVRSLADMAKNQDDSDDDEQNEYYAGGEKSGQVVKGNPAPKEKVGELFDRARMAGAEDGPAAPLPAQRSAGVFTGTARTLAGGDVAPEPAPAPADGQPPRIVHNISFYANGVFTIDDGEPRRLDDPANKPFLDSIARGDCPKELAPSDRRIVVNVNLIRVEREYVAPPKPKYKAFGGTGRLLSADDGPSASSEATPEQPAAAPAAGSQMPWEGPDESKDTTSLQLRLADGSRMVARFNLDHTVGDIRRFIRAARPEVTTPFRLMTAFPQAQLEDDAVTISAAGLANAVIIQKL